MIIILAVGGLTAAYPSSAAAPVSTVCTYTVYSKGFRIGTITSSQHSVDTTGSHLIHFETKTSVKASFLWLKYHLETLEKGTLKNGVLVTYSRHGEENGERADVEGRLEDDVFKFQVKEKEAVRTFDIPRRSYDATTMELPEGQLDLRSTSQIGLRVLDVERPMVVKRVYRLHRETTYSISGKEYPCQVVDFSDQNKSARRWIHKNGVSVVMLRQDGSGSKGGYSVQAVTIKEQ